MERAKFLFLIQLPKVMKLMKSFITHYCKMNVKIFQTLFENCGKKLQQFIFIYSLEKFNHTKS